MSKLVGLVGWRGMVGSVLMDRMVQEKDFDLIEPLFFSTSNAGGKAPTQAKNETTLQDAYNIDALKRCEIIITAQGGDYTTEVFPKLRAAGWNGHWIDAASTLRMEKDAVIILDPVNMPVIQDAMAKGGKNWVGGNCTVSCMLMGVGALYKAGLVEWMSTQTYQAASGAGWAAMEELKDSTRAVLDGKEFTPQKMPYPYGFNLFSHNTAIDTVGYNEEEMKMVKETKKILSTDKIAISPTCIRVPILRAHAESINIEFAGTAPTEDEARALYANFPGVRVVDDRAKNHFPMPLEASGEWDCLVGRIRKDVSMPDKALNVFIAGDQLLKGAALNAVQIAALL